MSKTIPGFVFTYHKTEDRLNSLSQQNVSKQDFKTLFPIFNHPDHRDLVYLDSAATTQKPDAVIRAVSGYYQEYTANVHRGAYAIAEEATGRYEGARERIADFIDMPSRQVIFVRGTTDAMNTVAVGWGDRFVQQDDEILVSELEHHSNIVPWQMLARRTGASLKVWPASEDGVLSLEELDRLLTPKTRLLAVTHVSNVLGTVNPVRDIVRMAHDRGVRVVVDGAQGVPHQPVSVRDLDADFYAFSGHKMLGPTGIGVLAAKEELLEEMNPVQYGGDMIREVGYTSSTWNDLPWKFEGGTQNIAGVIGLAAAIEVLSGIGYEVIQEHEREITTYAMEQLSRVPDLRIFGPRDHRGPVVSFTLGTLHPHDLATSLDRSGIAIRSGHHCAQWLMKKYQVPAMARASFYIYNSTEDVDALVTALNQARDFFKKWL